MTSQFHIHLVLVPTVTSDLSSTSLVTSPPHPRRPSSPTVPSITFPTRITNFSHAQGELQVMQSVARECYDQGGWYMYNMSSNSTLQLPPFYIISYKNNFFAVGCNSVAASLSRLPGPSSGSRRKLQRWVHCEPVSRLKMLLEQHFPPILAMASGAAKMPSLADCKTCRWNCIHLIASSEITTTGT